MYACIHLKSYKFMKLQNQNLAERLAAAAAVPLPLPPATRPSALALHTTRHAEMTRDPVISVSRGRPRLETVQMTIRPSRALREKLDQLAIQRAVSEARIITAQEIALEFLEKALATEPVRA